MLDFIRIACAVPAVKVGDVKKNTADICNYLEKADAAKADIVVFPELAMTGYTCGDLFLQDTLWESVKAGLRQILACSAAHPDITAVVGMPVRMGARQLNCAVVISGGGIRGVVPKTYMPDYGAFSESRWFDSADDVLDKGAGLDVFGIKEFGFCSFGTDLIFQLGDGAQIGIEICEDFWAPLPPSSLLAMNGAEVILNLAASNAIVGKRDARRDMVKVHSAACKSIYAFCSAGCTESTADTVFSGQSLIAENGVLLKENDHPIDSDYMIVQDCDLGRIRAERRKNTTFRRSAAKFATRDYLALPLREEAQLRSDGTLYPLQKLPFIPSTKSERDAYCKEVFQIQAAGLAQRLKNINSNAVIGISGGLDSTLALLVCVEAMRRLGRPATDIYGVTMPCFGTSDRTYHNSWELMKTLGINAKEISIKNAVTLHFEDIGHDKNIHNGTYENSQARERTQILMDYASVVNGIVVGTGDLSELALGWCTYNGDHMSMYGVNGSIPKTLIRWIIEAVAEEEAFAASRSVLMDILDTPISPELLPPDAEGKIAQQTEDLVGPYALHDFYLYHMLSFGFTPGKIYTLACRAFKDDFEPAVIKKWLRTFYWRFFTQQFKRNCMPDGAKALPISFSPRGDWQMPSDSTARIWLDEVDTL